MIRRLFCCLPLSCMLLAMTACAGGDAASGPDGSTSSPGKPGKAGSPLYEVVLHKGDEPAPSGKRTGVAADPIILHECRLTTIDKQDVPSLRTGVVLTFHVKPGDVVKAEQLLAELDDRLPVAELDIKKAKIKAAEADYQASKDTRDEAKNRYETQLKLYGSGGTTRATSLEEVRAAKLAWDRYISEAGAKKEGVSVSEAEKKQSDVVLEMHKLRSKVPGVVTRIYKQPGEAVKEQDTVMTIQNIDKLRVEGLVPRQYLPYLRKGMKVTVEPAQPEGPQQTLIGHLHEVTSVAVSNDLKNPTIVSGSEDNTARVWDRLTGRERRVYPHPAAVRAVACTPRGASANLCLSGAADGRGRLYDLASSSDQPVRELKGNHRGAITCVAFTPDGRSCATGGEDREIRMWDVDTGDLRYVFPAGHRGAITSLQFTPTGHLVSAGRDNTLRLWSVAGDSARLEKTVDRRTGDVTALGVSPDGKRVLFDQGRTLRVLAAPGGLTDAVLQNPSSNFTNFALFSPDGNLIVTATGAQGEVQLWQAPVGGQRARELRQFTGSERMIPNCASFAPDGTFLTVGTRDKQVLVWPVPDAKERARQHTAELTLVEQLVDTSGQVRVWAELDNPESLLRAGGTVTLVIYPE